MSLKTILMLLGVAGIAGIAIGYYARLIISLGKRGSMELIIRKMQLDAEERAKKTIEEAEVTAKHKAEQLTQEARERAAELKVTEDRLIGREELLDKRQLKLDSEQDAIAKKQ